MTDTVTALTLSKFRHSCLLIELGEVRARGEAREIARAQYELALEELHTAPTGSLSPWPSSRDRLPQVA